MRRILKAIMLANPRAAAVAHVAAAAAADAAARTFDDGVHSA